jgi:hypothetical protein
MILCLFGTTYESVAYCKENNSKAMISAVTKTNCVDKLTGYFNGSCYIENRQFDNKSNL